jgi:hypothetical protein
MVRVVDTLNAQASDATSFLERLAATAIERSVDGTKFLATEFHELSPSASSCILEEAAALGCIAYEVSWDLGQMKIGAAPTRLHQERISKLFESRFTKDSGDELFT